MLFSVASGVRIQASEMILTLTYPKEQMIRLIETLPAHGPDESYLIFNFALV